MFQIKCHCALNTHVHGSKHQTIQATRERVGIDEITNLTKTTFTSTLNNEQHL